MCFNNFIKSNTHSLRKMLIVPLVTFVALGIFSSPLSALEADHEYSFLSSDYINVNDNAANDYYGTMGFGLSRSYVQTASGYPNETIAYIFFRKRMGLNVAEACGALANLEDESKYNPQDYEPTEGAYGICQWRYNRLTNLKTFCANNGYDYTTIEAQLEYLNYEVNNDTYERSMYKKVIGKDNNADGAYWFAYHFALYTERCGASHYIPRAVNARDKYWPFYSCYDSYILSNSAIPDNPVVSCSCSDGYSGKYICINAPSGLRIRSGHGTAFAQIGTCIDCGYIIKTEKIPKIGSSHTHNYSQNLSKDANGHWHECTACGAKTDYAEHSSDDGSVTLAPTAYSDGIRAYSCLICGYVLRTEIIPATGYYPDTTPGNPDYSYTPPVVSDNKPKEPYISGNSSLTGWAVIIKERVML